MKQNQSKLREFFINNVCDWREGNRTIFLHILNMHTAGSMDFNIEGDFFKIIDYNRTEQIQYNLKNHTWSKY